MSLRRSTPSAQGVDAAGLLAFVDAAEQGDLGLHSLMVARHGQVVAEGWWRPYAADRVHLLYSCSKSFTAVAVGLLVDAGRVRLDDPVLDHLPMGDLATPADAIDPRWRTVLVEHCLSMTVGHPDDAWGRATEGSYDGDEPVDVDWLDLILRHPPELEPGTVFAYNQVATYLLARTVEHVSGERLLDFLRPRMFDPLAIGEVGTHTDTAWHALGFSGVHATTEALLSLAQLHLDEGRWEGRQLLSREWVARARVPYLPPPVHLPGGEVDWEQGYGFNFWVARHGYRGDGAFGQFAVVLPEHDMVVAITAEQARMQSTLNLLWKHLLPAVDRPGSLDADTELAARMGALAMPLPDGDDGSGPELMTAERAGGDVSDAYEAVEVRRVDDGHELRLQLRGEWLAPVHVADGDWAESVIVDDDRSVAVVASGGWHEGAFEAEVLLIETPHRITVRVVPGLGASLQWRMPPLSGPEPLWLSVDHRGAPGGRLEASGQSAE